MTDYVLEIHFQDESLEEAISARLFVTATTGSVATLSAVDAYFDSPADRDEARRVLAELPVTMQPVDRPRVDWLERYQQSLEPLFIGEKFIVAPDVSLLPADPDRLTLVVPQEQAFGTGSHETTSLCIEMLESLELRGTTGLDAGSGSGILALAMHRLGARRVVAFDNDPDAYAALRENRLRNGVDDDRMPLFIGGIESLRGGTFEVITMNIVPEVIIPILDAVVERMDVDGRLILSGILETRSRDVLRAAETHGLHLLTEKGKGEWWAGVFGLRRAEC
jgi:ribosomal protein L11 methyltransferase